MLAQLSDDDKQVFEDLLLRLKQVKGDISLLSPDDIKLVQSMEKKYGDPIEPVESNKTQSNPTIAILETPFAGQVRQIIARDLGAKFPMEEDAVAFVFENKWLPIECQDEKLSEDLYKKFERDINEANHWQKELTGGTEDNKMAVGLAWFMVIFQLNKRLSES